MKADHFIVGRVSSETKARLRVLAEREQLSESALLRRLVELVLLKAGLSPILTGSPFGPRSRRGARLMIRLRPDDQILLRERAAARGMPAATYVSVLTRAHLRSLAPLPAEELLALKSTLAEMGSIGRNEIDIDGELDPPPPSLFPLDGWYGAGQSIEEVRGAYALRRAEYATRCACRSGPPGRAATHRAWKRAD